MTMYPPPIQNATKITSSWKIKEDNPTNLIIDFYLSMLTMITKLVTITKQQLSMAEWKINHAPPPLQRTKRQTESGLDIILVTSIPSAGKVIENMHFGEAHVVEELSDSRACGPSIRLRPSFYFRLLFDHGQTQHAINDWWNERAQLRKRGEDLMLFQSSIVDFPHIIKSTRPFIFSAILNPIARDAKML